MSQNVYFQSRNNEIYSWTLEPSGTADTESLIEISDSEYTQLVAGYKPKFTGTLPAVAFSSSQSATIQAAKIDLQTKIDEGRVTLADVANLLVAIIP